MTSFAQYNGYKIHVYRKQIGWRALVFYPNSQVIHDVIFETDDARGEYRILTEAKAFVRELLDASQAHSPKICALESESSDVK